MLAAVRKANCLTVINDFFTILFYWLIVLGRATVSTHFFCLVNCYLHFVFKLCILKSLLTLLESTFEMAEITLTEEINQLLEELKTAITKQIETEVAARTAAPLEQTNEQVVATVAETTAMPVVPQAAPTDLPEMELPVNPSLVTPGPEPSLPVTDPMMGPATDLPTPDTLPDLSAPVAPVDLPAQADVVAPTMSEPVMPESTMSIPAMETTPVAPAITDPMGEPLATPAMPTTPQSDFAAPAEVAPPVIDVPDPLVAPVPGEETRDFSETTTFGATEVAPAAAVDLNAVSFPAAPAVSADSQSAMPGIDATAFDAAQDAAAAAAGVPGPDEAMAASAEVIATADMSEPTAPAKGRSLLDRVLNKGWKSH